LKDKKEKVVKVIKPFTIHVLFGKEDMFILLVAPVEDEDWHPLAQRTKEWKKWQFCDSYQTWRVSLKERIVGRYWRMKIGYKYKLLYSTKKVRISKEKHKPTYKRKIHHLSQYQILLQISIIFQDHHLKSISKYNFSSS